MGTLSLPGGAVEVSRSQASEEAATGRSSAILQVATNLVFGVPFLWCLLLAVRGRVLWSSHRVFADGIGRNPALVWVMAAAVGALWLGVSLMLSTFTSRKLAGLGCVVAGSVLLVGFHP